MLDLDEELHDRGREVALRELVRVEDGGDPLGRVRAVARLRPVQGDEEAEELGEVGAQPDALDVVLLGEERDDQGQEVVELGRLELEEEVRRPRDEVLDEVGDVLHAKLGSIAKRRGSVGAGGSPVGGGFAHAMSQRATRR